MRAISLLVLLAISQLSFASEDSIDPVEGTWYFISGDYTNNKGEVSKADNKNFKALRTMKDGKMAIINMGLGVYHGYVVGSYEVTDKGIVETITDSTNKELIGKSFTFNKTIKDGNWLHEGQVLGNYEQEIWKRLDF